MKIAFIVNPRAGVRRDIEKEVRYHISRSGGGDGQTVVEVTSRAGDGERLAAQFAGQGFDVVASVGGDGTANEVTRGLLGSNTALAIIPFGSGNGLARGLGLPLDIDEAVRAAWSRETRTIDVGEVFDGDTKRIFIGFMGIGYDALVAKSFNERKGRRGLLTYLYLSLKLYRGYQPPLVDVRVDNRSWRVRPFVAVVANTNEYGNGARIAPSAIPDDGFFDYCEMTDVTLFKGVVNAWRLFDGSIGKMPGMHIVRAKEIEIASQEPILYHLEGEPLTTSNRLLFRNLHRALRVVVPRRHPD